MSNPTLQELSEQPIVFAKIKGISHVPGILSYNKGYFFYTLTENGMGQEHVIPSGALEFSDRGEIILSGRSITHIPPSRVQTQKFQELLESYIALTKFIFPYSHVN